MLWDYKKQEDNALYAFHNHEVPGSIPGPATKLKSADIRHLGGFHSWVSFFYRDNLILLDKIKV